jgi:hypothetical protein
MRKKGYSGSFGGGIIRKIFNKLLLLIAFLIDRK